jgi:hypothetical protein
MNAFFKHHQDSIRFSYRCFDRLLLNGCIQHFLDGARALGFFWVYRKIYPVSRKVLRDIASQYHNWVEGSASKWDTEIVGDPEGRRDDFVEPYFRNAQPDQVVVIIKAREPAGYMTAIGEGKKWHLETKYRWVDQYNFYIQDGECRTDVRSRMSLLSFLQPHLSESALLAGPENEASRDSLYPNR